MKHNNVIPNGHFHKKWQTRVKTWFDQPMRKKRRKTRRMEKATKIAPRPTKLLRPAVHCPTLKYNTKVRLGRGFTRGELKAAGISSKIAPTIGIAVDLRRINRSEETMANNVARLNEYKSKLVIFDKKGAVRKSLMGKNKKGKAAAVVEEQYPEVKQIIGDVQPLEKKKSAVEYAPITDDMKAFRAFYTLRCARGYAKSIGTRAKKAAESKEKAEKAG